MGVIYKYKEQSRRERSIAIRNDNPPMVGVPDFDICHFGPSSYIGCSARFFKRGIIRRAQRTVAVNVKRKTMT